MYRIVFLTVLSSLLTNCAKVEKYSLPYYNEPSFTPLFLSQSEAAQKITHHISDFTFRDENNKVFSSKEIDEKIHVADFIFTSCGSICPTMTENMKILDKKLKSDPEIVLLSYSVTPWIDKPEVLKKYKDEKKIDNPNWHFLTGKKSDIYTLARKSYFAEEDLGFNKDSTEFLHTEHFVLVDKKSRIRGIYNGTLAFDMENLYRDIETLKKEKE